MSADVATPDSAKERLSAGLAAAARVKRLELLDIAERIAGSAQVAVLQAPSASSVLVELGTPIGAFCFTEVVVTTASVRVDQASGWAAVMGFDQEAALAAAVADAVDSAEVRELARSALALEDEERARTATLMAVTRV